MVDDVPMTGNATADGNGDLWAALLDEPPATEQQLPFMAWPDEADDLAATVRRQGGRLPGSDPRR
jgi:hypothetical protein